MLETDVAVVGAGPAGLSAAVAAARAGARVTLIEEYARPGGQFYKQLPAEFQVRDHALLDHDYTKGDPLIWDALHPNIQLLTDTLVWGCFQPGQLELMRQGAAERLRAAKIVVATGAYDRPIAFPGWDLPGVLTAGAAQTLVKHQQVLPGKRILLVGSGPFLLPVAKMLLSGGASLTAVLEATQRRSWARHARRLWGHGARLREGYGYLQALRQARVPLAFGWVIVRAEGDEQVERAVVARCDRNWSPIRETERSLTVDTICVGYGFLPATQLTRLIGCQHAYRPRAGGWVPTHDDRMETSVPGVFVAGEVAGIGGAYAAQAEGTLAGLAAARQLGKPVDDRQIAAAQRQRARCRAFGDLLNELFEVRPGLYDLLTDEVVVCRCEEVTAGEVRQTLAPWSANVNQVKAVTRAGMGPCQGRICASLVAELTARGTCTPIDQVDYFHPRPPLKPVPLEVLAQAEPESAPAG
jgi:thioredoxin reductase